MATPQKHPIPSFFIGFWFDIGEKKIRNLLHPSETNRRENYVCFEILAKSAKMKKKMYANYLRKP